MSTETAKAIEAFGKGEDVKEAIGDTADAGFESTTFDTYGVVDADAEEQPESTDEGSTTEDAAASEDTTEEAPKADEGDVEYITVTDDRGKRKIKVDYSNREAIARAHKMAAGMRKFQAERDKVRKENESLQETKQLWDDLEGAYSSEGIDGIIKLLSGGKDNLDSYVEREINRRNLKQTNPEAYDKLLEDERVQRESEERSVRERELEERLDRLESEREAAELKAVESQVVPVFDKYRYAGKLGDEVAEHTFDEMLWNRALAQLERYENDGVDLTPMLIDREFRKTAVTLNKYINKQVDKKANEVVSTRKRQAKETAQIKAMSGSKDNAKRDELMNKIRGGDLTSALAGFLGSARR